MIEFKRGDTFDFSGVIDLVSSGASVADMTGWTGSCQLRDSMDTKVSDVSFTWTDITQAICRVHVPASTTSSWPLVDAFLDIQLTSPLGEVVSTPTAHVKIVKDITR